LAYLLGLEGIALLPATNAAYRDKPLVIIWHFQLGGG
jgi:hypothetical protein